MYKFTTQEQMKKVQLNPSNFAAHKLYKVYKNNNKEDKLVWYMDLHYDTVTN